MRDNKELQTQCKYLLPFGVYAISYKKAKSFSIVKTDINLLIRVSFVYLYIEEFLSYMNLKSLQVRLIYGTANKWFYNDNTLSSEIVRDDLMINELSFPADKEILSSVNTLNHIIFDTELVRQDVVLLVTNDCTDIVQAASPGLIMQVLEVNEYVDKEGKVIQTLDESEINKVLRFIYNNKPKLVVISLLNSIRNDIHERALRNILSVPGYKCNLSSEVYSNIKLQ
jgi:hypothetical protein